MTLDLAEAYQQSPAEQTRDLPERLLNHIGEVLWVATFGAHSELASTLKRILDHDRVRLVVRTQDQRLALLPWECLRIPNQRTFTGLAQKLSIVHEVVGPTGPWLHHFTTPVRLLLANAHPYDAGGEIELIQQVAEPAVRAGAVVIEVVQNATVATLDGALRRFQPHVFHFCDRGQVSAEELGTHLRDHGTLLAVLNGHNRRLPHTALDGFGRDLVRQGVPAVIETTRDMAPDAALAFSRAFYRALLDGYAVESALTEGRMAVSVRKWDWSSYTLHANPTFDLDRLRIGR
jgi:hypothetical protein